MGSRLDREVEVTISIADVLTRLFDAVAGRLEAARENRGFAALGGRALSDLALGPGRSQGAAVQAERDQRFSTSARVVSTVLITSATMSAGTPNSFSVPARCSATASKCRSVSSKSAWAARICLPE
jgi:hypothetical protein